MLLALAAVTAGAGAAVLAVTWLSHIVRDRAVGYTLRTPGGALR